MTTPIFILSLPRSGSTLLQRILLTSNACKSLGETSLLLRFLGNSESVTRFASYRESNIELSFRDLRDNYPDFPKKYEAIIHKSMMSLYSYLAEDKKYFIDKTPRYTLIAEEIRKTFPEAKVIILWRHPLAIAASISNTFFKSKWHFDDFLIDFETGWDRLHTFAEKHAPSICSIRYEDLLSAPTVEVAKLNDFLDLPKENQLSDTLLPEIGGRLGDPKRHSKKNLIDTSGVDTWKQSYSNWYRKRWARQFYTPKRSDHLSKLGYDAPDVITPSLIPAQLFSGIKDWRYHRKKARKGLRLTQQIFQQEHISPYGFSQE